MNSLLAIAVAFGSFGSTLLGGVFAIHFKDKLHTILGFSAGAVIGLVFFDLLPESLEININAGFAIQTILSITAVSFLCYMILDRYMQLHTHNEDHSHECQNKHHKRSNPARGNFGAGSFAVHSFLDGVAIGLAFQLSQEVGIIVAIAVLVHDFSDGINTVNLVLKNGGKNKRAFVWLLVDSAAPVVGVLSTFLFSLPEHSIGILLAIFSGFFLYIGASELLPESHHGHAMWYPSIMTVLGASVLYIAIKLAGI